MYERQKFALLILGLGLVLPVLLFSRIQTAEPLPTAESSSPTEEQQEQGLQVCMSDGSIRQLPLEEYLVGVVAAEMPSDFEPEALKAQAVVARTYCLRQRKHTDYDVCTDAGCCQGYCDPGELSEAALSKLQAAVAGTEGLVLCYDGALIEATYFSCSGGSTEDAVAVWGGDCPYLQSVESPGEEDSKWYENDYFFSREELEEALNLELEGDPEDWCEPPTLTRGGGVERMWLGDAAFSGTELRRYLGLPSTAFTVEAAEDGLRFTVRGFGHRVGMSQYGADAMAAGGADFREILTHYYTDVEICPLSVVEN